MDGSNLGGLDGYIPNLPDDDWRSIRVFTLAVVSDVARAIPYPLPSVLNAVTHHVDWCVNIAGIRLERDALFGREIIGAAVAVMPTSQESSRARRRSLLFRVGEQLGTIPVPPPLPALAASSPRAPYNRAEIAEVTRWAYSQNEAASLSARLLVALGLGAGLQAREIATVRGGDILAAGDVVNVRGAAARRVPVLDEWASELALLTCLAKDARAPLFRPNATYSKNIVTVFVDRTFAEGLRPSTQRMRATWLVHHMSSGTPLQDLLATAGLSSANALVRYEQFLPPATPPAHEDMPR